MNFTTPRGMSRRHFMQHLAGAPALAGPALALTHSLRVNAAELKKNHKSCILLWMGGGPPTIDMWDMKPGATTGGQFKPISTAGDGQINELLPNVAKQMKHLSIVRSIVDVCHDLGMECIAECAETEAVLRTLVELDLDYAQGYVLSRPLDQRTVLAAQDCGALVANPRIAALLGRERSSPPARVEPHRQGSANR